MKKLLIVLLIIVTLTLAIIGAVIAIRKEKEAENNLRNSRTEIINRYDSLNKVLDTLKIEFDNRRKEIEENNKAIEKNNEALHEIVQSMKYRNENLIINNK